MSQKKSTYRKGANFERRVKKFFEKLGYYVVRSAGSHGLFDLVAVKKKVVLGVQCKVDGRLSKEEERKLRNAYEEYGIVPVLAYREGRKLMLKYLV